MRTIWILAMMLSAAVAVRADDVAKQKADDAAIRELYVEYDSAWNKGSLAALSMVWTDDAVHVEPDGRSVQGRAAIKAAFEARFAGDLKDTHSQQTVGDVHFVTPDVAVVDASYEVNGAHDAQGHDRAPIQGRYLDVWVRRKGQWYIAADRPLGCPPAAK